MGGSGTGSGTGSGYFRNHSEGTEPQVRAYEGLLGNMVPEPGQVSVPRSDSPLLLG